MTEPEQAGMERGEALALAERYAERGIPTFPIAIGWDAEKAKTTKRPLNANGHLGASTDTKRIRQMFWGCHIPDGAVIGVGLHLGPAGMFVLDGDIDGRGDGVAELEAVFARHGIFETVRTMTASGGVHAWLGKGTAHVSNASPFDAIDVRGDEGWVVAPGVHTPWGEWSFDPSNDFWDGCVVIDVPAGLLAEMGATDGPTSRHNGPGDRTIPDGLDPRDKAALEALIELGGSYSHRDSTSIHVTRPGKIAGTSATIGHIGPGVVKVFSSNWAPLVADQRYDADELIALAAARKAEAGATATDGAPASADPTVELDELLHTPEEPYDWLIPGLIEHGDRVILTGLEGRGKSTLLRQFAVKAASGIHPFDDSVISPLKVLYVDCENSRRQVRRKIGELRAAAGDAYAQTLRFVFRPDGIDLAKTQDVAWLATIIAGHRPDLVVIGPIYKMSNGDPKDERDAKAVATVLDEIRVTYAHALLIEAHTPYADGAKSKRPERPYGASLWSRWPEFGIFLGPEGDILHWRGQRDERSWPTKLQHAAATPGRGAPWRRPRLIGQGGTAQRIAFATLLKCSNLPPGRNSARTNS